MRQVRDEVATTARVGVDIGGTFTDAVLIDDRGRVHIAKARTTPGDPAAGFIDSLDRLEGAGAPNDIRYLAHGTTIATNAIVQCRLASVALVTNAGFADMLEIGTQQRKRLYDLWQPQPRPLARREDSFGIRGRIGADGDELEPLSEEDVVAAARTMRDRGTEAVAVSFLFSFLNSDHERRAAEILRAELPDVAISLSCEVVPEFREYLRASTTTLNAALLPLVSVYVDRVSDQIRQRSVSVPLHLMQSNGGVAAAEAANRLPVGLVASGPAAGVMGAARLAATVAEPNVLTFDMGGTTADVALVLEGLPQLRFTAAPGGFPVNLPQIDVLSIGAGGGSIARVDEFGSLSVGPESAGAVPGPACYPNGGEEPTVTDAHVTLGTISPERSLGGVVNLDCDAARSALEVRVAEPLGLGVEEAAWAVIRMANANMTNALRVISIARGHDPRRLALAALGGAGPLHACAIADELGVARVLVPRHPGVTAALGLLLSDIRHDVRRTWIRPTQEIDVAEFDATIAELEQQARALLELSGHGRDSGTVEFELDMRYRGQAYNLTVPLAGRPATQATVDEAVARFHAAYRQAYNYTLTHTDTEVVTIRARAIGPVGPAVPTQPSANGSPPQAVEREIWIGGRFVRVSVVQREDLRPADAVEPSTLIEQEDATTLVPPGWRGKVSDAGMLKLERVGER
jgi:N-methylhydantoinase A